MSQMLYTVVIFLCASAIIVGKPLPTVLKKIVIGNDYTLIQAQNMAIEQSTIDNNTNEDVLIIPNNIVNNYLP